MTLSRLKWLAIVAPMAFLAVLYALLHTVFYDLHHFPGILVLFLWAVGGVGLFSFSVFALVSRLERRMLDQNRLLEGANRELAALVAVGRAASSSLELPDVLDKAMRATLDVSSADAAEVWLRVDHELWLAGRLGDGAEALGAKELLTPGEGPAGIAVERAEPLLVRDAAQGFGAYCALPLRVGDRTVGVLGVAAREHESLSGDDELRLLSGIAERLAMAIENAQLHGRVLEGAVVEERVRIARELHDGVAQLLGYINAQTLAVRKLLGSRRFSEAERQLGAMEEAVRRVYADVREAILGLRGVTGGPEGIVPALRGYLADYGAMAGVTVRLDADDQADALRFPASVEIQVVRIVQEALSNVRKHARAENAWVSVRVEGDRLAIDVVDDGQGFDPAAPLPAGWPRFGLQTMRERVTAINGTFDLVSRARRGTTVSVSVPVPVHAEVPSASAAR